MNSQDSSGCFAIVGIILMVLALNGLWQARLALLHHGLLYSFWNPASWMNPWQAVAAFALLLIIGLLVLLTALKRMKNSGLKSISPLAVLHASHN